MIFGDHIHLPQVLNLLLFPGHDTSSRQNAVILCLVARYLICSNLRMGDVCLVHVINQLRDGHNPMMIVLAETSDGLDALAAGHGANSRGSPLLLHMWICEHFRILHHPMRKPIPQGCTWSLIWAYDDEAEWWVPSGSDLGRILSPIQWVCPWLRPSGPYVHSFGLKNAGSFFFHILCLSWVLLSTNSSCIASDVINHWDLFHLF